MGAEIEAQNVNFATKFPPKFYSFQKNQNWQEGEQLPLPFPPGHDATALKYDAAPCPLWFPVPMVST